MIKEQEELFIGRLGVEPKLMYTKEQKPVCHLSIAVNKEDSSTTWKKVTVWDKQAENCNLHLKKGHEVFVRGRKLLKEYKTSGGERKFYEVINASTI